MDLFTGVFEGLTSDAADRKTFMIDATYLVADRTASSPRSKTVRGRLKGKTNGGINIKRHAVMDAKGCPDCTSSAQIAVRNARARPYPGHHPPGNGRARG